MPDHAPDSLLRPGQNCCSAAHADRVALLVDGAAYFEAFMRAAERAERSIIILAWDFDSRVALQMTPDGKVLVTLGEFLNQLAQRRRGLHIHILDWDYPMVFGADREFSPLYGLNWTPHRRVHFRYDDTHPLAGSHHQKIVAIDDKVAFAGGLDLTNRRWDTPGHRPGDPRRVAGGKPYPPFHDLMVAVDGEAARVLATVARNRWQKATGAPLRPVTTKGDPWPEALQPDAVDVGLGVACTAPAVNGELGVRDVEQLYLDMIARAKRYIYIENQYFTADKIGDALAARLADADGPEIVLVSRLLSHGWLEEMTMHVLRTRLIRKLREADQHGRFHVYYPHVEGLTDGTCVDMHSKMMVIDDDWLRIGSANLSNRSMGLDTECDVLLEARGAPRLRQLFRGFRDQLIGEHTGRSAAEVAREVERTGSMHAAIAALESERRTLRPLTEGTEWPEAVIDAVSVTDPERPVSLDGLVGQFAPDIEVGKAKPIWKKLLAAAAVLLGLTLAWRYTPLAEIVTADNVVAWASSFAQYWWAPLAVVLAYVPASVIMFPRPLITLAAVVAFGPVQAFIYAMTGNVLAALLAYWLGRRAGRNTVRRIAGERLNRLCHALRARGLLAMTAVRLVPIAPYIVGSVVAGAIRIRLWHFVAGTFIGLLPGALTTTIFGDQLHAALRDPSQINYWLVGGVVAALIVGAVGVRRWLSRVQAQGDLQGDPQRIEEDGRESHRGTKQDRRSGSRTPLPT
jgi:phospholipase D1/2